MCVCVYSQENRLLRRVLNEKGTPSSSVGPVQDGNLSTAHSRSHFCLFLRYVFKAENLINTWSYNKVRELAIVCLPWQHSTKALVWFDDVDISAFHSCVVVDLWQSLSEWHLLMSACFGVPPRECRSLNYSNERTLNFLLFVDVDVSASLRG